MIFYDIFFVSSLRNVSLAQDYRDILVCFVENFKFVGPYNPWDDLVQVNFV